MISIENAQNIIASQASLLSVKLKSVKLRELPGYVLAQDIYADRDYPPFCRALMDGFALHARDYAKLCKKGFLVSQTVAAGDAIQSPVSKGKCVRIMTGAPLPPRTDSVIPKEESHIENHPERAYFSCKTIKSGQNVALQGEDIQSGRELLAKGKRVQNTDIASLASLGISQALVFSAPSCTILSTGNEIVPTAKRKPQRHEIRDANAPALMARLDGYHVPIEAYQILKDEPKKIETALAKAMRSDFVILSGGVSMGGLDIVPQVLQKMGVDCLFHRVNIKPAKPFWFGKKKGGPVIFGLPGNSLSVQVAFKIFVEPFLRVCLQTSCLRVLKFKLADKHICKDKRPEYFPCLLNSEGQLEAYTPRSSGDIRGALGSSGIALHPAGKSSLRAGSELDFFLWDSID